MAAGRFRRLAAPLRTVRRIVPLLWQCARRWTLASTLLGVLEVLLALASLYLLKYLVDVVTRTLGDGQGTPDPAPVLVAVAITGAVTVAYLLVRGGSELARQAQAMLVADHIQGQIHDTALRVDLAFYESPRYFDTLSRAREAGTTRPAQVVNNLLMLAKALVMMLAVAALVLTLHWLLVPVLLLAVIPAMAVRLFFTRVLYDWQRRRTQLEREAGYFDWLMTSDLHAKEVRLGRLGRHLRGRHSALRGQVRRERLAISRRRTVVEVMTATLASVAFFASLALLAIQTARGANTVGDLVLFMLVFQRAQSLAQELVQRISQLYEDHLYLGLLFEFLDTRPRLTVPAMPEPVPEPIRQGIVLEQVDFTYPGSDQPVLSDISLRLPPGRMVALVGENGSGKTSLIKLLCRLYDPDKGRITLDGIDVRRLDPERYRRLFSVLFQDYSRYAFSVRENIRVGDIDADPHAAGIEEAGRKSGADAFIRQLAQGYDTRLSRLFDDGKEISIGQWQKLALARAFFADSRFVVLDEPTSALDANAEFELFQAFRRHLDGRAALVISHRLSTIRHADHIYVLHRGRIVEDGDHDTLMAAGGRYWQLFERQGRHYR